ncbi:uncharacterized protein LOC123514006 [Portunus trituberculatus]|uniref:uncharacterized protein LOC123514006 n=1 Tax=Portunus trituberculatus TaxID=210409 RepID=UPI001E1CF99F|nr:uncharacterized protein LOC123514006 [Portunus trituberculatus]XP_045127485.1 uncharacterized protein LOC123514006 [Portunus trituberculatus]XP_045127486.1 uncharacterized protein LOC123514006 [Portunus trituberculatus]XP_045127487.1 uncharacterized protein LOC123514006 [Portunus trituberculatus]XP_045127488.1 uncharacterized protein LOC123514006 [Portunus trituberculatus]
MAYQQVHLTPDAISEDESNLLKLMKMGHGIARSVLYKIFLWGTKQKEDESVEHYLLNTQGYSKERYKKYFDLYQRQILSDKDKECEFDVTTLFNVIRHTCDKLETTPDVWKIENDNRLEGLVTAIKKFRNDHSHKFVGVSLEEMIVRSRHLRDLLEKALMVAGNLYDKSDEAVQEVKKIEEAIEAVRSQQLIKSDIDSYGAILENEKLKYFLKIEGAKELREKYKDLCQLNPVYFLESEGVLLDVSMVFTQIEVENAGKKAKGFHVPCHEILTFCRNNNTLKHNANVESPEAYLIEGPAGAGKTTLMKYFKSVWLNKKKSILGLDEYDLLLVFECRNTSLSSFSQLLCQLMPKTNATYFRKDELLKFTLDLKTLILVDGLDELNSYSERVFLDIINQNNKNLVVLCTSRPEKARHFKMHVPSTFHTAHLKIIGIADNRKEEFVRRYHEEMWKHGRSKQDTEDLINYIKNSESHLKSHYRLPLNLVLLTWLWADDPREVTPVTTSCELYIQTHNLMKKKLLERLIHHKDTCGVDYQDLQEKIKDVMYSIYKAALLSLNEDAIEYLLPKTVDQIKVTCTANKLPARETLSAFFVIKVVEEEEKVSVPHKLLHDFYAAQCIVQNLFNENQESKIKSLMQKLSVFLNMEDVDPIMKQALLSKAALTPTAPKPGSLKAVIDDLCIRESGKMNKYQSMLLHVAGIIYALHGPEVREWIAKEIVELLKESELGVRDDNQWFDLCELTKNEPIVISHISRHISKSITITDKRIGAALLMLQEARPKEISVSICRKTRDIPELQDLMTRIADVESQLDLSFWEDFWEPDSLPSNDQQVRTVSKRCNLGKVVCHVSGSVLAEMQGTNVYLNLAVTSDVAAQEVMVQLCNLRPNLKVNGLCLHLTTDVSPGVLRKMEDIGMLCLAVSGVQDSSIMAVCEMAKAVMPPNSILMDLRFPRAEVTYLGWVNLLKTVKKARIGVAHISIPEEVVLLQKEHDWLENFAHKKIAIRCAFRRLGKEQMHEASFSAI